MRVKERESERKKERERERVKEREREREKEIHGEMIIEKCRRKIKGVHLLLDEHRTVSQ